MCTYLVPYHVVRMIVRTFNYTRRRKYCIVSSGRRSSYITASNLNLKEINKYKYYKKGTDGWMDGLTSPGGEMDRPVGAIACRKGFTSPKFISWEGD